MSTVSGHWPAAENGTFVDKDNVVYERVMTYNPVTKIRQVIEPGTPSTMSPRPGSPYQTLAWATERPQQQQYIQEIQTPISQGPYVQGGTLRRYIVQNPEQEIQAPISPGPYVQGGTLRRYIVQNPEQDMQPGTTIRRYYMQSPDQDMQTPFQQGTTVRRYYVQNPEQQAQYLKGVNFVPGNNVVYEKTITRLDVPNAEQEKLTHTLKGRTSVSENDVHEQVHETKTSVTSSEQDCVFEQSTGNGISRKVSTSSFDQKSEQDFGTNKMDSRYFGELLAELSRKNNDLYSCLLQHVEKIGGRKHLSSTSEYESEDIESVLPKGSSELTKQQIRYLLQMRQTSDKSMRLVLSTFSTLREDLGHLQADLNKLENDKSILERDLAFKESQVKEYETLLASVRGSNREQQQALKESSLKFRRLEEQILLLKNSDADKDYRLKELEYSKRAMEQEADSLRLQISDTCSSPTMMRETEKMSKYYMEMIATLREEKDKEIQNLRSQISTFQHDVSSTEGSSRDLQMKIIELTSSLQRTELKIKKQEEELFRLRQERETKGGVTTQVITKRYRNQYPILGLLSDYNYTAPVKDSQTVIIERTEEMWKKE